MARRLLRLFARVEVPAAWCMVAAGLATFLGVVTNLLATGDAKWATLIVSADLFVSGFSAVQSAYDEDAGPDG